jgi:hypothetical protein
MTSIVFQQIAENVSLSVFIVKKLINPIEKNKSALNGEHPAPIPGCHTPEGCCVQCCGFLDLTYQHTESPVSWPQRFSISGRGSVTRQSWLSHRQRKSAKAKTRTIQLEAFLLENALESWMWETRCYRQRIVFFGICLYNYFDNYFSGFEPLVQTHFLNLQSAVCRVVCHGLVFHVQN